jgi:hypothetical protein
MLSEILCEETVHGDDLRRAIEKLVRKGIEIEESGLNDLDKERELKKLRPQMHALRQNDNADEYDEYIEKFIENNPHYKKAAKRMAQSGDPLLLWVFKHLVSKTQTSS